VIQSGTLHYNVETRGWDLASGSGERWLEPPDVAFDTPFSAAPKVSLALSGIDADQATNLRLNLEAYDIGPDEFSVRISTWDDTLVYAVWVAWIAHD
jgi:hypothetical protein